jgi:two-component system, LytTR family, response regulator
MLKVLIVEDDPISYEVIRDILDESDTELEVVDHCTSVKSAVQKIRKYNPQLIFLDIELGDGSGFDVLKEVGTFDAEVIVTTSNDKYALEAIKHSALDYLLKPLTHEDVKAGLKKVQQQLAAKFPKESPKAAAARVLNRMAVPTSDGLIFLQIADIIRLESDRNYTEFFLQGNKKFLVTKSLKEYEELLRDFGFIRVHHSHIINLNHLARYVKGEGGYVIMSDNSKVDVSRRKKEEFLERLAKA